MLRHADKRSKERPVRIRTVCAVTVTAATNPLLQHRATTATYVQQPILPLQFISSSPVTNVWQRYRLFLQASSLYHTHQWKVQFVGELTTPLHISANLLRSASPDLRPSMLTYASVITGKMRVSPCCDTEGTTARCLQTCYKCTCKPGKYTKSTAYMCKFINTTKYIKHRQCRRYIHIDTNTYRQTNQLWYLFGACTTRYTHVGCEWNTEVAK